MGDHAALMQFVYGALGGGTVAFAFRFIEEYLIAPRFSESLDAHRKLILYARPLWLACQELEFRLSMIAKSLSTGKQSGPRTSLAFSLTASPSIDWFTKDGYFLTSTAYLIAAVSCWIQLYERDVVFLKFGRSSLTKQFFDLIQEFKQKLSNHSILWFHYINGIGEELVDLDGKHPISLSEFTKRIYQDQVFRGYYDQLFVFLNQLPQGRFRKNIVESSKVLCDIMSFLEDNKITMPVNRQDASAVGATGAHDSRGARLRARLCLGVAGPVLRGFPPPAPPEPLLQPTLTPSRLDSATLPSRRRLS